MLNNIPNHNYYNPLIKKKYKILFIIFCILILLNILIYKSNYLWCILIIFFYIFRKRFTLLILLLTYFNLIKLLQLFVKQDTFLLMDCEENAQLIDCYSMFEYLQSISVKSYYIIYNNQPQINEIVNKYKNNIIIIKNPKLIHFSLFFKLIKTKYFLTSFASGTRILKTLLRENKKIDYIFMQHGVVFTTLRAFKNYTYNMFNKVLVSSEIEAEIWKKYGNFPENTIIKVGLPRWDLLMNKNKIDEKSIFIFFTWRTSFNKKNYIDSKYYKNILSLLNNKDFQNILKTNNIKIYYGIHHALLLKRYGKFIIHNQNIEVVNIKDISEYVKKCNLLITDYSSISFDFLFQNKPVIYYLLDKDDPFLNKRDLENENIAFIQLEKLFNRCIDETELIKLLEFYIKNNFILENNKQKIIEPFFSCKNNIREKIYNKIIKKNS